MSEYRYRFVDTDLEFGPRAILQKWPIACKTAKGAWILPPWAEDKIGGKLKELKLWGAKFTLDGDGRRWAYETEDLARKSYKIRKQRQLQHAHASIERAQQALDWLETGDCPPSPFSFWEAIYD